MVGRCLNRYANALEADSLLLGCEPVCTSNLRLPSRGEREPATPSPTEKHAGGCGGMLTISSMVLSYEIRAYGEEEAQSPHIVRR